MANNSKRAEAAIERYVSDRRPNDLPMWRSQTPNTSWGMNSDTWFGVGKTIIGNFNALYPKAIQINPHDKAVQQAIKNCHAKPLPEFERYLTLKADGLGAQALAFKKIQGILAAVVEFEA
jgi:hypothetical protein